jgi:drug/metabolite transporter (DMT)-like permease
MCFYYLFAYKDNCCLPVVEAWHSSISSRHGANRPSVAFMKTRGYDSIILAIVIWSTQTAVSKVIVESLGFIATTFYVSIGTALAALTVALILKKGGDMKAATRSWRALILISIPLTIANLLLFYALTTITASEVIVLLYIYPIIIMLLDLLIISHRISYLELIGMLIGFAGVYLLISYNSSFNINSSTFLSAVLVIVAAISGLFTLFCRKNTCLRNLAQMRYTFSYLRLFCCQYSWSGNQGCLQSITSI